MGSQKPLLIPWLITKIDSAQYPGLEWVNSEKTKFRIPWKHALRQDLSEDNIKIFKDWAIDSGCYNPEKQKKDPSRWKRNFRAALNQKDNIRMVDDFSSDASDPHKVFEILRRETESVPTGECAGAEANPTFNLDFSGFHQAGGGAVKTQQMTLSDAMNQLQLHQDGAALFLAPENGQNQDTNVPVQEINYYIPQSQVHVEGAAAYCVEAPLEIPSEEVQAAQPQQNIEQQILRHFAHHSFVTDFEVNIYYRGTRVRRTVVTNHFGFCLTSRQQPSPGSRLEDVVLPSPSGLVTNQLLVQAVNCILTNLEEGTLVEVRNGAICARRLGSCRSFWSITHTPATPLPNPIDKNDYSVLYTLQQFIVELMEFIEGRRNDSPQYSIWICLGETWPDGKPWEKKCIMVEIIPVVMRLLHEMSYSTGASSLSPSDVNLEISNSLTNPDAALSILRSIEEMMDWTP